MIKSNKILYTLYMCMNIYIYNLYNILFDFIIIIIIIIFFVGFFSFYVYIYIYLIIR